LFDIRGNVDQDTRANHLFDSPETLDYARAGDVYTPELNQLQ